MNNVLIGIDIGGTNTEVGVIELNGEIIKRDKMPTRKHGADFNAYLTDLVELINSAVKTCGNVKLVGIGIGAPNGNYLHGTIEQAPNLEWEEVVPICKLMSAYFPNIPIELTNDANAAAMGEMLFGAAKGYTDFITITLGTGVGSGIVCNGQLVYGHDGFAGEIGHTTVYPNGRLCGCGRYGCIEAYLSASGLAKTAAELMVKYRTICFRNIPTIKMPRKIFTTANGIGWHKVFKVSGAIDPKLADVVATTSPKQYFYRR